MKNIKILSKIFLLFPIFFSFTGKSQTTNYNTDSHFSLSISLPFKPLNKENVKEIEKGMNDITSSNDKLLLVFTINNNDYPNIQVKFTSLPSIKSLPFTEIVKTYKNMIANPETLKWAKDKLGPLMKIVKLNYGNQLVNFSKKMFLYIMKANTIDYGFLVKVTGMFVLSNGIASINFVCKEIEIENYTEFIYKLYESVIIEKNYIHIK